MIGILINLHPISLSYLERDDRGIIGFNWTFLWSCVKDDCKSSVLLVVKGMKKSNALAIIFWRADKARDRSSSSEKYFFKNHNMYAKKVHGVFAVFFYTGTLSSL